MPEMRRGGVLTLGQSSMQAGVAELLQVACEAGWAPVAAWTHRPPWERWLNATA